MNGHLAIQREQNGDTCVVRIAGRVASGTDDKFLQDQTGDIKSVGCAKLLVDIRELHSIGSSGIGFFVELFTSWARRSGGRMVLLGPSPHVRDVLSRTRLFTIIPVEESLEAANAFLSSGRTGATGS